ncbi:Manganese ABC transporter, inner membrane permease protein SitD [plant metagenome]|uniref:Manganese ABC transporter, inner membrane permease protein SitD n=1 Tax=plant metagenome TaxID=1297885 RepID=A0A484V057_9ZZZZ
MMLADFLGLSLTPALIGLLASVVCALLGNFLVLRRQSLIGDAVSHVVLPGVVGAFLVTGTVSTGPMLAGAAIAAVLAVGLIEAIRKLGRIESGAAMGVVFTALFAAGVLWLERSRASAVHLDVEHVLYGNLESLIWLAAIDWGDLLDPAVLAELPVQLPRLAVVLLVVALFLFHRRRELVLGTFDADFAASVGARPGLTGFLLLVMVAVSAVAAFEAVGAILVVAMFICPAAAARLMTDKLGAQIGWSVAFAALSSLAGFFLAAYGPMLFGSPDSVSAAGMIAVMSGLILAIACVAGPRRRGRA